MVFLMESIIGCILFTLPILALKKDPISGIHDYPPAIIERCKELGLITEDQEPRSKKTLMKKLLAAILIAGMLGIMVFSVNKVRTFSKAFLITYALWLVIDWYDAIVVDCAWFCHDPSFIIPGTEDMEDEYHNYKFHLIGSLRGSLYGLPVALAVAGVVKLISIL